MRNYQTAKIPSDPYHVYFMRRGEGSKNATEWIPVCRMLEADFRAAIADWR